MINFFRSIRQRMLRDKSIPRYLFYAIGEIVLVVIGILIALQVNNWNETRKNTIKQSTYLKQLSEDIETLKKAYDERLQTYPDQLNTAFIGLRYLKECNIESENKSKLDSLLMTHQFLSNFFIINDTYNEMQSANIFVGLENKELKNAITNMYSSINSANKVLEYFRADLGRASAIIWRHVTFGYDANNSLTVDYDLEKICDKNEFHNALVEVVDSREDYLYQAQIIQDKITVAHDLIIEELRIKK